jgi:hypothetical protein
MSNPFEYIANIRTKTPELSGSEYNSFMCNRGFSYYKDVVHYANMMNMSGWATPEMQYTFMYHAVPKGKQVFGKWAKADKKDEDINLVSAYFQCNRRRAAEILSIINKDELIPMIEERMYKGGMK